MFTAFVHIIGRQYMNGYSSDVATTSAFVQQRAKILPIALEFLFHEFTHSFGGAKKYRGYRLLAVDGSDLHTPTDPHDAETYLQNSDDKGYNLLHLNAMYDLCNRLYVDALIQPIRRENEHRALVDMAARSRTRIKGKVIVIADRGYESYSNIAHIG
jgi:hypothetical protein